MTSLDCILVLGLYDINLLQHTQQYPPLPLDGSNSLPFLARLPAAFVSVLQGNSLLPCLSQINTMQFGEDYCKLLPLKDISPFLS